MATLVLTGAGNVELTRRILSDLFVVPELAGTLRVVLHDIDRERLDTAQVLADRLNAEASAGARIEAHLDRRAALDGADFVVCQLAVGGFEAALRDFEIPARYGLRQTIADTIGIGGIFRGLRTIPVLVGIAADMAECCPDAWLLSYTDPLVMSLWAVRAATGLANVAGLCHAVRDTHAFLADAVGRDVDQVSFLTAGLPHQAFVLEFAADGRSLYPELADAVAADPRLARHVRMEIWRRFGFFPTESSEHAAEYVPWFMSREAEIRRLGIPVGEYLGRLGQNLHIYEEIRRRMAAGRPMLTRWQDPEIASEVLVAMLSATPRRINLTVANDGLIPALGNDCFVEVPATVDGDGITPRRIESYPVQLAALNRTYVNVAELTVHAVLDADPRHIRHAAMLDPNTAASLPLPEIAKLCDEMMEAHRDLLPAGIVTPDLKGEA
ncbi:family 4 glycosyl hydrolase [Actinoallomurus soli]|uniref:family 4 glycosyl hydrolase n=1 Tax=Actinoallomurus soli TaxID=2952535 RepID=UPI0020925224|nr:alpha-glucosidase/alpha-galactosidase [Actinoallomurus soli]MCO5972888.1 alpha-glucosidase/alpha-galactosidase [Actinoallomurus soli]